MATPIKRVELAAKHTCRLPCGLDRDRVVLAVEDEGRDGAKRAEPRSEIVIAQAAPDFLLGSADYAKGGELPGLRRVVEVRHHRELEHAMLEGVRVADPEIACPHRVTRGLERRGKIALGEAAL